MYIHTPSANDCSSVFCPRWVFFSDQTSDSTGNKRSLCRCVIVKYIQKTVVIPWLWLFWPIVRLYHNRILTSLWPSGCSDFTRDFLVPSSLHANDLRWICCLPAIERHQALNLTFVLQSSPSTSQLHSHGSSFVTKNCLQRQLSWLSSCLSNLFLSSIPLRHASSTTIYQASALNSQAFPLHSLHLLQY